MNIKRVATHFFAVFILLSSAGEAFVPKAPHLLYLVIEKIRRPAALQAFQSKKIVDYEDVNSGYTEITERLLYAFPDRFRSDVTSGRVSGFTVQSEGRFVKVADGYIVSTEKQISDAYTDVLLYRDYNDLMAHLARAGVVTDEVVFKRYRDTVCYVIGAQPENSTAPFSSLWVEKETYFPLKYVVLKDGWVAEFYYENWRKVSKTWYPMRISIFLDQKLHAVIDVASFELKNMGDESYFDVESIIRSYPAGRPAVPVDETAREVIEMEEGLRDFGKMFE